jgi:[acyl-carrier-protein] S-malonyltransferase
MTDKLCFVFPGQGSQSVGMLAELAAAHPLVRQTFEEGSEALGVDLWQLSQQGPEADLNRTDNTQPAMLAAGVAVWRVWQAQGGSRPIAAAGHSLGEYSALVAAGRIAFGDAIPLVARRGRYMQEAVPEGQGAMAAVLGLSDDDVRAVCESAAHGEVVEPVNFNSPGQVVIAGAKDAVDRAVALAKEKGAKRALLLPVSVPSHCSLMQPAAAKLAADLANIAIAEGDFPVLHNVNVAEAADAAEVRDLLARQLHSPVRWVETIEALPGRGVELVIEAGPGKVLAGLGKRINKQLNTLPITDPAGLDAALEAANA